MGRGLEVVILCGGRGTRAYPDTAELPKPLLTVRHRPIVEHVMRIYALQGHVRFLLAAGYKHALLADHFRVPPPGTEVTVLDTGEDTETGDRLAAAAGAVEGDRFLATYGDGLGAVDLARLTSVHERSGSLFTMTTVPLPSQYGTLVIDDAARITDFREKPLLRDHWINAGYFLVEKASLPLWQGSDLEKEVLPGLAGRGVLYANRHEGFWKSMDTYKDRQELERLAVEEPPPWLAGLTPTE